MSRVFDVVVVGAGMFGSAAARHLSQAGADVLVVGPAEPEDGRRAEPAEFSAHYDEARIARRLGWDPIWATTDGRSLERFRKIEGDTGITFFHECGSLVLLANTISHRTEQIMRTCEADGITVERVSAEALRTQLPELGLPPMVGGVEGLWERQQAGYLNPRALVQAQLALTAAADGQLLRAAVTGLDQEQPSGLWRVRVAGSTDEIRAAKVLLATGAFTNHLGLLAPERALALHAFTEPNLLFEVDGEQLRRLRSLPTVVTVDPEDTGDANMSTYLLPPVRYPDGRWYLRLGPGMQPIVDEMSTVEPMVEWLRRQTVTPRQDDFLRTMMRMLVPTLEPVSVQSACCIIDKTPSRYPYIGPIDDSGSLSVVVGGNGHGARGSDEIGRLAATVVLGQPWDCPIGPEVFQPQFAADEPDDGDRPSFLRPPFGLC